MLDENKMNNIACLVLSALPRVQAFSRFLMKDGRVKHLPFFFFLFGFLLCLALLDKSRELCRATADEAGKLYPDNEI